MRWEKMAHGVIFFARIGRRIFMAEPGTEVSMDGDLLTIQFLKDGGTLAQLEERYGIGAKRHGEFPNLVMLKYNQIDSPMSEPLVQECRGLILDEADGWRVISFPFRKFFNAHEGNAATIDWPTAKVYEKLDGSLMTLYWYRDAWRVASSGMPDASGPVNDSSMTFADLFWATWSGMDLVLPRRTRCCFMFELMTPHNRVIVPHVERKLSLIGARSLGDGLHELDCALPAAENGWPCVSSFPLTCLDDCISAAKELRAMECEGFVVCDDEYRRIKIKSPQYVALAHMKDQFSARRMLEVVRANESEEFLGYFPEMRPIYQDVKDRFGKLCDEVESDYARLRNILNQKDFAIEAVKTRCSSALFAIRAGKAKTAREFFATATLQSVERAIPDLPKDEQIAACIA